jgi:hypothetical protein
MNRILILNVLLVKKAAPWKRLKNDRGRKNPDPLKRKRNAKVKKG